MSRRSDLVNGMAEALKLEKRSVNLCARYLREAGQISQRGRGPTAAHMGPSDATNLLLGCMASDAIKDATKTVSLARRASFLGGFINGKWIASVDELPLACLKKDGEEFFLGRALDELFDATVRTGDLLTDEGLPVHDFNLKVWRPGLYAEIEFNAGDRNYVAHYSRPHPDLEGVRGEAEIEALRKVRADTGMKTIAEIDIDIVRTIADILRVIKPKDGEDVKPPYMK